MPFASIDGTNLHYEEKGQGIPLVLLHAFPVDGRMWESQLAALGSHYRVIVPDFRGFGQSPAAAPFTIDLLAGDIHKLMMHLPTGPAVVGGLSMGGYVALAFAEKFPQLLRGLMLMDTRAEADDAKTREGRGKMIELARTQGSRAVGEAMQSKLLSVDAMEKKPVLVKKLRAMTDACSPQTIEFALGAMRDRPDRSGMLKSVNVPTLILVGDADTVTPVAVADAMHKSIAHSEQVIIKGAGHLTAMEQPEQVNTAILRFLSQLSKP
jgi:3-oxoadipate enol-lactonase